MCTRPPYSLLSPTDGRTDSFSPSILRSSRNIFILGNFNCDHPLWDSKRYFRSREKEVFGWVISSDLLPSMTLTHPLFSIAPLLTFPLLPPLLPFLAPVFRPPSFNFQKADGMTLSSTLTPTIVLQRNICLFPLLLLSLPLWH